MFDIYFYKIRRYFVFILQIIGWTLVLYVLAPIRLGFFASIFKIENIALSDFILLTTAAFVLAYTYETKKLREESVYQRKILSANDIRIKLQSYYFGPNPKNRVFARIQSLEAFNNVASLYFLSAGWMKPIGRCDSFSRIGDDLRFFEANYFMNTEKDIHLFLNSLKNQGGIIKAKILITNGERFTYTFQAVQDNWKRALDGAENLTDDFILVKKELDYI